MQLLDKHAERDFCVMGALEETCSGGEAATLPAHGRTRSPQGLCTIHAAVPCADDEVSRAKAHRSRSHPLARGRLLYQDVLKAGTGRAVSNVVTRCHSALTGHDVGRWRRIRSLYCLTCVATLKSVRITVEGWAVARAVWASVWVRRAWCKT